MHKIEYYLQNVKGGGVHSVYITEKGKAESKRDIVKFVQEKVRLLRLFILI